MGIILGLKPKSLHIKPLGVMVVFESYTYGKLAELKKILISIAGPMVNLAIIIILKCCRINLEIKQTLLYSNFLILLFNLIPIYPLDGGRILKSLIRLKKDNFQTEKIINKVSNLLMVLITGISSILILYMKNIAILLVIIYLWIILIKENKHYGLLEKINKST